MEGSKFIKWAKDNNWWVVEKKEHALNLKDSLKKRYKSMPQEYIDFLKQVSQMIVSDDKTWFLCEKEYNETSEIAFKWNEYERMSLEAAGNDKQRKSKIISWWKYKLPIVMSVKDGYSFYAIDLKNNKYSIVRGHGPEFEKVDEVADNLDEFLQQIMLHKIIL